MRFEAVHLFVERAKAMHASFRHSDRSTMPAIVEICRRLDGVPLALELAAARACAHCRSRRSQRASTTASGC